jgi:hypothetical protein
MYSSRDFCGVLRFELLSQHAHAVKITSDRRAVNPDVFYQRRSDVVRAGATVASPATYAVCVCVCG